MEVVLQWLDELDDAVFTVVFALLLRRDALRRTALGVAMLSSFGLAGCELAAAPLEWMPCLTAIAAVSLAVWAWAALATGFARLRAAPAARAEVRA